MPITEPTLLLLLHGGPEPLSFTLPPVEREETVTAWKVLLDTDKPTGSSSALYPSLSVITVPARTIMLLEGSAGQA